MIKSDFAQEMPEGAKRVHFVGIGGAGMSGIAQMFHSAGITVTGSDIRDTSTVQALREAGIAVSIGHRADNVAEVDSLVVSGAIAEDNPEFVVAQQRGLPVVHRARALAWLSAQHRVVAVAGAHGKTTSTAMVVTALQTLGADPSFVNGGVIRSLGVSAGGGSGDTFVIEADESDGSFLLYSTAVALITNVDPDHLDHYGSERAFTDAFVEFARRARESVVISADDPGAIAITADLVEELGDRPVITFGQHPGATVHIDSIQLGATVGFSVVFDGKRYSTQLRVPGLHNALNAAGAFGVLTSLGCDPAASLEAIAGFEGTERRFELRGEIAGIRVFDDFAHHPTEIRAALSGARAAANGGKIIPIFQPHLFSRTRMLAAEFASVFDELADYTIVVPIYGARQDPEPGVSGRLITERFADAGSGIYLDTWGEAIHHAVAVARPGDLLMPMGGGDIYQIIPDLLAALAAEHSRGGE